MRNAKEIQNALISAAGEIRALRIELRVANASNDAFELMAKVALCTPLPPGPSQGHGVDKTYRLEQLAREIEIPPEPATDERR